MAKRSPPGPHWFGSQTASMPAAASAASQALPPRSSAARPARAACGLDVATIPRRLTAGVRGGASRQVEEPSGIADTMP
jgi:hypothetical protein